MSRQEPETFEEYLQYAEDMMSEHPEYRRGQAYFNALYEINPKFADTLSEHAVDPFYVDAQIPVWLEVVEREWPRWFS